ncbi:MAG TPA: hypothetical protein VJB95_02730 [Candidatus Paceibacterota bacterium]
MKIKIQFSRSYNFNMDHIRRVLERAGMKGTLVVYKDQGQPYRATFEGDERHLQALRDAGAKFRVI